MRVLTGILLILAGGAIIYRHKELYKFFGDVGRSQKLFGDGLIAYPLIGVALIVLGILSFFGVSPNDPTDIKAGFG